MPQLLLARSTKPTPLVSATGPSDFQAVSRQKCGWATGRIPTRQVDSIDCNPEFFFLSGSFGRWDPGPAPFILSNSYASGKQSDEEEKVGCRRSQCVPNTVKGGAGGRIGKGGKNQVTFNQVSHL